jgi:hypothetical protein
MRVFDDHAVIRQTANRIDADSQRINCFLVHQTEFHSRREPAFLVLQAGLGALGRFGPLLDLEGFMSMRAAGLQQLRAGLAKIFAPPEIEMHAVKARVGHNTRPAKRLGFPIL